jgi:hypothetical protein
MSKPALYRLLTFHITNPISIFLSLGHLSKESFQVCGPFWHFVMHLFFTVRSCWPHAQTPSWRTPTPSPLTAFRDWLFNIFAATLLIWRPSSPSATWRRAMLWWQVTHLTWRTLQLCLFIVKNHSNSKNTP